MTLLAEKVAQRGPLIRAIYKSTSWKLSCPLRIIARLIGR